MTERLSAQQVERAAELLRAGGTVAFPTETVYGLGANALSSEAIAKIFAAKQRPAWDPLIVHIAERAQLAQIATVPVAAEALIEAFWPGPLTLLLPRTPEIPDAITAGRALVGVRIPEHRLALELLGAAAVPIAAPSANTFGHTSPTTAAHVLADLDGRIDAVLDGGATSIGLESTVAEVREDEIIVYRQGAVTLAMLQAVAPRGRVLSYQPGFSEMAPASLPSPGVGIRHYAPRARVILAAGVEALGRAIDRASAGAERTGVMLPDGWDPGGATVSFPWGPWTRHEVLAQRLYTGLRHLDDAGCATIVCPVPEGDGIAAAIRDRLLKAAKP